MKNKLYLLIIVFFSFSCEKNQIPKLTINFVEFRGKKLEIPIRSITYRNLSINYYGNNQKETGTLIISDNISKSAFILDEYHFLALFDVTTIKAGYGLVDGKYIFIDSTQLSSKDIKNAVNKENASGFIEYNPNSVHLIKETSYKKENRDWNKDYDYLKIKSGNLEVKNISKTINVDFNLLLEDGTIFKGNSIISDID
ncbi:hypothetical protein [Runella salmonicolor]|uniref:LPS export ABC transporter periplasmic protein LptC n=1 Tax=Runella salmonicolor TaxID=2950278 RepID=A0ABT1FLR3_9BACT|nr:hypothetical protein [Runella salmonicolor]MCP1382704.1 hypothetical protein [Runella salmonicolor]